jgi:signal transduction histidine kinase/PAS domain-containing protein
MAAVLQSIRSDQLSAVIVGDFQQRTTISRERFRLLKELFDHFIEAHNHAAVVEKDRLRLILRNHHVEIVNSIFDSLGSKILNVGDVLARAAQGLRNLGYRRVGFCLVDPKAQRIQGVVDLSDDRSVSMSQMIDWPLDNPLADIEPYVIQTGTYKIVENASQDPLVNKHLARVAKLHSLAIVPILDRAGRAIGTIHVERADGAVPSQEEAEDLVVFGRQLAAAIEQSERVNLLQSALDKIPEPVLIVDPREQARYANKPAAELFGLQPGWKAEIETSPSGEEGIVPMLRDLRGALAGNRIVHHVEGIGRQVDYRGAVLCDSISDRRGQIVGAFLHVQDLNYLYRVFDAFGRIAEATDASSAMRAMLEATRLLGHQWGRLYLIDEQSPDRLVSRLSFGFKDSSVAKQFDAGLLQIPHRLELGEESWSSIEQRQPLVIRYATSGETNGDFVTPRGLKAITINQPSTTDALQKEGGEMWLDFPLVTSDKVIGKLTLQCDESLRPENFGLLKVLCDMAAGLLDSFLRRDRMFQEREQWIRSGAERSMSLMAHNLNSRLASLPTVLARYRLRETEYPAIMPLNDDLHHILANAMSTVTRAKEKLSSIVLNLSQFDLSEVITNTLRRTLPSEQNWTVRVGCSPILLSGDSHVLESAFVELIQNSLQAARNPAELRIEVSLGIEDKGGSEQIHIVYQDNGPGIPADLKDQIFHDFFSHRPGKRPSTGLGLAFVQRAAAAHGGTVHEEGLQGAGAIFVIDLPRSEPCAPGENR